MNAALTAQLEGMWRAARGGPLPTGLLQGSARRSARARAAHYGRAYTTRTRWAMGLDFPTVAAALGAPAFAAAVDAYMARCPSRAASIDDLGDRFAADLDTHPPPGARADLAALAALEWARLRAARAAAVPVAAAAALAALPPDALQRTTLQLAPHVIVLELRHDPCGAWQAAQDGRVNTAWPPPADAAVIAVFRREARVLHTALPGAAGEALWRAAGGAPLTEICHAFAAESSPRDAAFAALGSWFADGFVAVVGTGP